MVGVIIHAKIRKASPRGQPGIGPPKTCISKKPAAKKAIIQPKKAPKKMNEILVKVLARLGSLRADPFGIL
jgi:hypothetical protein